MPAVSGGAKKTFTVTGDTDLYAIWENDFKYYYSLDYYTVNITTPENGEIYINTQYGDIYFYMGAWKKFEGGYYVVKGFPCGFWAKANEGYEFDSWTHDLNRGVQQDGASMMLSAYADCTISANFKEKNSKPEPKPEPEPEELDYNALSNKMSEAVTFNQSLGWEDKYFDIIMEMNDAIEYTETLKNAAKTQAEVDAAVTYIANALTTAMQKKTEIDNQNKPQVDYTALKARYQEVYQYFFNDITADKYADARSRFYTYMEKARKMYNDESAESQEQADQMLATLNTKFEELKAAVAAIDNAGSGSLSGKAGFDKVYQEAQDYYNEIRYTYSEVASRLYSAYRSAAGPVTWGGSVSDEEYDEATAKITKALQTAKEEVEIAKVGYDIKDLNKPISKAIAYYNGIEDIDAATAAKLKSAIEEANARKATIQTQNDVQNAAIDMLKALAEAMNAIKEKTGNVNQTNMLAYVTSNSEHRKQYAYDEKGRTIQALGMQYNSSDGTWDLDTCYTYEYPDQFTTIEYGKTTRRYETEIVDGKPEYKWEWMCKKVTVQTSKAKEEKLYYINYDTEDWNEEPSSVNTTEYDEQGRIVKQISEGYMDEYSYDGTKRTHLSYYKNWGGEGYYLDGKTIEDWDKFGNLILEEKYYQEGGEWILISKTENYYSEDNTYMGKKQDVYSNGEYRYTTDDTYNVERDEQGRIVKKTYKKNGNTYSTITHDGYVSTEITSNDRMYVRVIDNEGSLVRFTTKSYYSGKWHLERDMKFEYDKSILAADVIGSAKSLREPSFEEYGSSSAEQITYPLKYVLTKVTSTTNYGTYETIYAIQPATVQPASFDETAEEPVITIPIAKITDKIECAVGAVIEVVDAAGNVIFEKNVTPEDLEMSKVAVKDGVMTIKGGNRTYHSMGAKEFNGMKEEEIISGAKGMKPAFAVTDAEPSATFDDGTYFVQIAGGAVKINGSTINEVMAAMTVGEKPAGIKGDVNGDTIVNIDDVSAVINVICGSAESTPAADVDGNGIVNIDDVSVIIGIICGN